MDLQQLTEKIGFDSKTFMCYEPNEEDEFIKVFYPNYMQSEDLNTKPQPVIDVLKYLEVMVINHQKQVHKDLKLIRKEISYLMDKERKELKDD